MESALVVLRMQSGGIEGQIFQLELWGMCHICRGKARNKILLSSDQPDQKIKL